MYAIITKIKNVRKHSNADRLKVGECFGENVIVGLETKEGQIGLFIATDSQISEKFGIVNELLRMDYNGDGVKTGYIDFKKRNIRAISLRGEKSEGLFLSLESLSSFGNIDKLKSGDVVDIFNGEVIATKYIPKKTIKENSNEKNNNKKKVVKENKYPFFAEHSSTSQLAYNKGQFKEGDDVVVTLKIHGTSARTSNTLLTQKAKWWHKLLKVKPIEEYKLVSGSRRVVLTSFDDSGFYKDNNFRKKYHDLFAGKLKKGEEVFYEIVGYTSGNKTIMSECDNKKVSKDFVKKYGKTTNFSYGCSEDENDIYIYRMNITTESGDVIEYPWDTVKYRAEQMDMKVVPELDRFKFATIRRMDNIVNKHIDGADPIGLTHIREGICLRINSNSNFKAYKAKSFNFKVLEGIIKDSGVVDMEEAQDIHKEE